MSNVFTIVFSQMFKVKPPLNLQGEVGLVLLSPLKWILGYSSGNLEIYGVLWSSSGQPFCQLNFQVIIQVLHTVGKASTPV